MATSSLCQNAWTLLRLDVADTQVRISVDGVFVAEHNASTVPASVQAGFAASTGAMLRVDDFAVYGVALQSVPMAAPVVHTQTMEAPGVSALPAPAPSYVEFAQGGYPRFVWQPVVGAVSTTIEINDVCGDDSPIYTKTTTNLDSYQMTAPDPRLLPGEYVYCLKANDGQDSSVYSTSMPLKIAYNRAPFDGDIIAPDTPLTLYYDDSGTNANTYKVTIDDEPTFTVPFIHESQPIPNVGEYTPPAISTQGTYYWRVTRLTNGTPDTVYSTVSFKFILGSAGSAPTITSPEESALRNAPVTIAWNPSTTGPSFASITSYQIEISTHPDFLGTIVKHAVTLNNAQKYTFTPPVTTNDKITYFVRVMGMNGNQRVTEAAWLYLRIGPTTTTITAPAANSTIYEKLPTFTWSRRPWAYTYLVTLKDAATQAVIIPTQSLYTSSFMSSMELPLGTYILSVDARDRQNNGSLSTVTFTIAALPVPPAVANLKPVNGGSIAQEQSLTWDRIVSTEFNYYYEAQISRDSSFTTLAMPAFYGWPTSYYLRDLEPGTYYWRVRGVNRNDGPGPQECVPGPWANSQMTVTAFALRPPTLGDVLEAETGRPEFRWHWTNETFKLEVNDVCGDGSPIYQHTAVNTGFREMPATAPRLYPGEYLYCLKVVDAQGGESAFASKPFQVIYTGYQKLTSSPYQLSFYNQAPASGETIKYKVYIDDEPTLSPPYTYESAIFTAAKVGTWNYHSIPTFPAGRYYWGAIRLINGVPEPVHSPSYSDLLIGKDGSTPIITSPADFSVLNGPVTVSWNKSVIQPTYGTITHYRLTLTNYSLHPSTISYLIPADAALEYTYIPPANLDDEWYTVGVHGMIDGYLATGSNGYRFYVDNVPPGAPVITWPPPNVITDQPRPTFSWLQGEGAYRYEIQILDAVNQTEVANTMIMGISGQLPPSIKRQRQYKRLGICAIHSRGCHPAPYYRHAACREHCDERCPGAVMDSNHQRIWRSLHLRCAG